MISLIQQNRNSTCGTSIRRPSVMRTSLVAWHLEYDNVGVGLAASAPQEILTLIVRQDDRSFHRSVSWHQCGRKKSGDDGVAARAARAARASGSEKLHPKWEHRSLGERIGRRYRSKTCRGICRRVWIRGQ